MKLFRALVGGPSMWSVGIWPKPAVQYPLRDVVVREAAGSREEPKARPDGAPLPFIPAPLPLGKLAVAPLQSPCTCPRAIPVHS